MLNKDPDMTIRNCYDSSGQVINDTEIKDYEPLKELLEMFNSLHTEKEHASLEQAS